MRSQPVEKINRLLGGLSLLWGYGAILVALFGYGAGVIWRLEAFAFGQGMAALLWIAGSANRRWAETLAAAEMAGVIRPLNTFTLREMFLITTLIAVMLGLTSALVRMQSA